MFQTTNQMIINQWIYIEVAYVQAAPTCKHGHFGTTLGNSWTNERCSVAKGKITVTLRKSNMASSQITINGGFDERFMRESTVNDPFSIKPRLITGG